MTNSTAQPNVLSDPGFLFWAPLASSEPSNTVAGSVFTDAWPVAWINLGATKDGSQFDYDTKVDPIRVAELFDPVKFKTTERSGKIGFALADITLTNLKRLLNGGTLTVVSGTGGTTLTSFVPPTPGNEVRCMIGWESLDATMRLICYQTLQGGTMSIPFKPGVDNAVLPAEFNLEVPSGGVPFKVYGAGSARG